MSAFSLVTLKLICFGVRLGVFGHPCHEHCQQMPVALCLVILILVTNFPCTNHPDFADVFFAAGSSLDPSVASLGGLGSTVFKNGGPTQRPKYIFLHNKEIEKGQLWHNKNKKWRFLAQLKVLTSMFFVSPLWKANWPSKVVAVGLHTTSTLEATGRFRWSFCMFFFIHFVGPKYGNTENHQVFLRWLFLDVKQVTFDVLIQVVTALRDALSESWGRGGAGGRSAWCFWDPNMFFGDFWVIFW